MFKADTWPQVFDDSVARDDWKWCHKYDIDELVDIMITSLRPIYEKQKEKEAVVH